MKEKIVLEEFPEMLRAFFGHEEPTNVVPYEVINALISNIENMPEPLINHPVIFCGEGEHDPICEVGFDAVGNVVFFVDDVLRFAIDEENWLNHDFSDLQESYFCNGSERYILLEGTYSGETVTNEQVI